MKTPCRCILIALFTLLTLGSIPVFPATVFDYTLPATSSTYRTSAAVYDSDDILIRTLWRKEIRNAGANSYSWDDKNDSGVVVLAGTYKIQVICHNINYVWEGAVGNSSAENAGKPVNFAMNPIQDIAITRDIADAASRLGIALHDHIVIGGAEFRSFRAMGLL